MHLVFILFVLFRSYFLGYYNDFTVTFVPGSQLIRLMKTTGLAAEIKLLWFFWCYR